MIFIAILLTVITLLSLAVYYVSFIFKITYVNSSYKFEREKAFKTKQELLLALIPYQMWIKIITEIFNKLEDKQLK